MSAPGPQGTESPGAANAAPPATAGASAGPPAPPPPPAKTPAPRRVFGALARSAAGLALVACVVAGLLASGWWALGSARGSAWLLAHVPGLEVVAPSGALLGDFHAQRIAWRGTGREAVVALTDAGWRGLTVERAARPLWLRLRVSTLYAARVDIPASATPNTEPLQAPADLRFPVELEVSSVQVGEIHLGALPDRPMRALTARVHLNAAQGTEHLFEALAFAWERVRASGEVRIGTGAPMPLRAALGLAQAATAVTPTASTSAPSPPPAALTNAARPTPLASTATAAFALPAWSASIALAGPLAAPQLQATLRAAPAALDPKPAAPQSLDATATLRPFARWPLGALRATTRGLDLSAFSAALPATALDVTASAASTAADQPASVSLAATNARAGRWNEGRLPLRRLALELAARPDQPSELEVSALDAELGTAASSAGRVTGRGHGSPDAWQLALTLAELHPEQLDARAPAMQLSGPLAMARRAGGTASFVVQADLDGLTTLPTARPRDGAARPRDGAAARRVTFAFDASLAAQRIEVRRFEARAGGARATLSGLAVRAAAAAPWAVQADLALVDFDPLVWWPGAADSPWRQARHRLNASAVLNVSLPIDASPRPWPERLAAWHGSATLTLGDSVLADVPVRGTATLRHATGALAEAQLDLDAGGNRLRAQGRMAPGSNGAADTWEVTLDGPRLDRLAPIARWLQPGVAEATLAGAATVRASATGRWPAISTVGKVDATAWRVNGFGAGSLHAEWSLGSAADAPVSLQATLTDVGVRGATGAAGPSADALVLQLSGTARAHTVSARAESKARLPEWADALVAAPARTATANSTATATATATARSVAVLRAQGGLVDVGDARAAGWKGTVNELELRGAAPGAGAGPAAGATAVTSPAPSGTPWLRLRDAPIELAWAGGPMRASAAAGRAELLGGAVRWRRLAWQAEAREGGFARVELDATIEPLRIAPLLARLQPDFGWGGDLSVAGRIVLRPPSEAAPGFNADVVLERASGDLTVTEELGTRALGLTDLRVALTAADGVWSFTQGLAGKTLGVLAGAVVVRTAREATWPQADAPLEGVLEVRVDDLGTWGNWVPPGWRLGGTLHSSASFGGRFGAPEYTGLVEGSKLSVRNFLQGVNVSEGDLLVRLQGTSARIERFTARGGSGSGGSSNGKDGSVKLDGTLDFGAAPKAVLTLMADKFQLLGRVDRRIVASGSGQLQIDAKTLGFDGRFTVDEGLIDFTRGDAPTLGSDVQVVRAAGAPSPAAAASAAASPSASSGNAAPALRMAPPRDVVLDVQVGLGERLRMRGRGLDTGLRGELQITSPGNRMAVNGTVRAVDGTYAAYGQKLKIDRGIVAFSGAVENPRLDIEATRPNLDVRVGVAVSGNAASPRVRLFSEPELSEIDKLSWLVMGRASDGLGRTDTALLQRAALALLAGEGTGPTDQLTKALGLDELSVRQTSGEVRDTVIALGKQISQRWYVGYERGLNATTGSFQLIYRIAQRFTLRAQSGEDNSLDLIWTWRWN